MQASKPALQASKQVSNLKLVQRPNWIRSFNLTHGYKSNRRDPVPIQPYT